MNPYPNPFNSQSNIKIILPATSNVEITIFNSLGESVQYFNKIYSAGENVFSITNSNLVSGIYYYSITVLNDHGTKNLNGKLIYIK